MTNWILEYSDQIESGQIITSKRVRKVYKRLADLIRNPHGSFHFDEKAAQRPIKFIERFCKHSKGEWAGKPVILELFQKAFISALFGFVDQEGIRQYREGFFYVARKNGKSTMLACIALYCLIADKEPGAEVYSLATKKDQAKIIFDEVCAMVSQSPDLLEVVKKRRADLFFPATLSKMQPLGKNADTLDGLNTHLAIIDELHAIKDRELYEVMKQSQSVRRQPLLIMITTAGFVRESIFDSMYDYAARVADGDIADERFLPILYELDKSDEWTDPKAWIKANPSLGKIKKVSDIVSKVQRAKDNSQELAGLLCKDFNVISNTSSSWLTYEQLDNRELYNIEDFRNSYAVGGADLSLTTDLTCASILILGADGRKYIKQMYWIPEDNLQERLKEKIPYDIWIAQGYVRLCKGNSIDYHDITKWFKEVVEQMGISPLWIYYDPYSAKYWVQEMESEGFKMEKCYQGVKTLSGPMQFLETDLKAKKVIYDNNPVLKWCLSNTGIQIDRNGNLLPIKARQPKNRIDGMAALLDCYVGLSDHLQELEDLAMEFENLKADPHNQTQQEKE